MANVTQGNFITAQAGADLSAKQYYITKLDASGNAILAAAASDDFSGVLDEVPQKSTGLCSISHVSGNGTGKVIAAATISKGAYITSDASGKAVAATQTSAGSQPTTRVFGRARVAAVAGDVFEYEKMFFLY